MLYVDVRDFSEFEKAHIVGSSSLPLDELEANRHLWPAGHVPLTVLVESDAQRPLLPRRGGPTRVLLWAARPPEAPLEAGARSARLWRPNAGLEAAARLLRWPARRSAQARLRAVDLACGSGRDLLFLLENGFRHVTGVDHKREQIAKLPPQAVAICRDLESTSNGDPFEGLGPAMLVNVSRYLCRPLFPKIRELVAPGGVLVFHTFYDGAQNVGKRRPKKEKFLLKHGELQSEFGEAFGFEVLRDSVALLHDGRPTSVFISKKRRVPLFDRSCVQLRADMLAGRVSCEQLMKACLGRIQQLNPTLNALVSIRDFSELLSEARQIDEEGIDPGKSLHGLPIAIKDLYQVKGLVTTYGSPLHANYISDQDDDHVRLIRDQGAIIVAKSNTPEWGAGSQTFNPVFGTSVNYYDQTKTVGGSSGGAACALSARMIPLADGSDLAGSLRNPAAFCNVIGFRPSVRGDSMSTVGAMGRTVDDVALLHGVIFETDMHLADIPGNLKVAWTADFGGRYQIEPEVRRSFFDSRWIFQSLGCQVNDCFPQLGNVDNIFDTLRSEAFKIDFATLMKSNRADFKETVIWQTEKGLSQSRAQVNDAIREREEIRTRVDQWFSKNADFLVCPSTQVVPFDATIEWVTQINGVQMSHYIEWMRICSCISTLGLPAVSVPCGFTADGLPLGLQIVGRYGANREVLNLAKAYMKKFRDNKE